MIRPFLLLIEVVVKLAKMARHTYLKNDTTHEYATIATHSTKV